MLEWRLRRASADDAAAASLVASASFLDAFYDDLDCADLMAHVASANAPEKFATWANDPASVVMLACQARTGVPIGYSVLTAPDLPIAPGAADIELKRIYLLPGAYGTGLAAELLARAVTDAAELGRTRLLLGVYGKNYRAQRFYEKHGFTKAGTRQFQVGSALHDDLIYTRSLSPQS
jgi:ribosomal protein S18 acetylase RimI-like enzyme